MKFRQKVGRKKSGEAKHSYMLSDVYSEGTMLFVCRNCPSYIQVTRATMFALLVMKSGQLKFLTTDVCPQEFPNELMRVLPERNYNQKPLRMPPGDDPRSGRPIKSTMSHWEGT